LRRVFAAAEKSQQIRANMVHSPAKICKRIPQVVRAGSYRECPGKGVRVDSVPVIYPASSAINPADVDTAWPILGRF
jgi:hypothetical protein